MFVGHLAVAVGAKSVARTVPLPLLIGASFGIDLLCPIFLLFGIETVAIDPGNTAFTALAFVSYPWSHSLLMTLFWGALLGVIAYRFGLPRKGSILVGAVLLSHWILDWLTHSPDLPLWPGGTLVGLGLWNSIPATLVVEGLLVAVAVTLYLRAFEFKGWQGRLAFSSLLILTVIIWAGLPFLPPPPDTQAIALVALSIWLLPLWGIWIEKNVTARSRAAYSNRPAGRARPA